jgi:hypothetical protein
MDSLMIALNSLMKTNVAGGMDVSTLLIMSAGTLIPILVGILLPRKKTIQYGMLINKTLGLALLQKRHFGNIPTNIIQEVIATFQTTFQDVSFGVYIDARKDLSPEEKQKKIDEYLTQVKAVEPPKETPPPQSPETTK